MARNDLPGPGAPNFQQRLREAVMTYLGRTGDPLDRGITLRDLIEGGIARLRDGYTAGQAAATGGALPIAPKVQAEEPDLTPPPTPTGFTASAAISHVFIGHDAPLYTQGHGHLRTRVYGKIVAPGDPLPVFADAVEITQFTGTVHAHPSNPSTTWRLWIKWESADGVLSVAPAGGTNGLQVVTGQDVSSMVAAMTGAGKPFTVLTAPTVIGGVTFPAGIYSTLAFIQDLQVTNAKIANLAVDDAKIADLSVEKLNGAQMKVGAFIQSTNFTAGASGLGWRINADGTAELQAAFIRGQLTASQINGSGLVIRDNSGNPILSAGSVDGTMSVAATAGAGFRVGNLTWDASGNRTDGAGVAMTPGGLVGHNGTKVTFSISSATGEASFGGALSAAAGSFVGSHTVGDAARSNNTMTGAGAAISSDGTFAMGNATRNLTFDGTSLTMNGDLVVTGNIANDAITESFATVLTSHYTFTMCPGDPPHVILSGMIDSNGGPLYIHSKIEFLVNGFAVLVQLTVNGVVIREVYTAPQTAQTTYPKGWALDFEYVVNPGTGSNQVALRAVHAGGTGVCRVQGVSANDKTGLFVLALKR